MTALLLFLALSASTGDDTFQIVYPTNKIILLSAGPVTRTKTHFTGAASAIRWPGFFRVYQGDAKPVNGVFDVGGKPVKPTVTVLRSCTASAVVTPDRDGFTVIFQTPGKATFRVAVGSWSRTIDITVKQSMLYRSMPVADMLEMVGFPHSKHRVPGSRDQAWAYTNCPDYLVGVGGDPVRLLWLTHESRVNPEILARIRDSEVGK